MFWIITICICLICLIAYQLGKQSSQTPERAVQRSKRIAENSPDHQTGSGASVAGAFMAGYLTSEILNDQNPTSGDYSQSHPHFHSSGNEGENFSISPDYESGPEDDLDILDENEDQGDLYTSSEDDEDLDDFGGDDFGGDDFGGDDFGGDDFGGGEF